MVKGELDIKNNDFYIMLKFVLCIYIARGSLEANVSAIVVVSFILIYIITIFIKNILSNKYKLLCQIILIFQLIITLAFTIEYIDLGIFLVSITIGEYFIYEREQVKVGSVLYIAPLFLVRDSSKIDHIIIISIIILIFMINDNIKKNKILKYKNLEEKQRNTIYKLNSKLVKERDMQEQILYTARLEERNQISTRLHDKIGHTISGTLLQLEAIKIILDTDKEKGFSMLDICTDNLREGMNDIRMTLRNIKPKEEELGINRIRKILDEKIKGTRIIGKVSYSGDLDKISSKVWLLFIQGITELTTNSIKYSNCDLVTINIEVLKKFIKIEIRDNGQGCKNIKKGIGINSLEDKINNMEGKMIINGDNSFSIIILIPY